MLCDRNRVWMTKGMLSFLHGLFFGFPVSVWILLPDFPCPPRTPHCARSQRCAPSCKWLSHMQAGESPFCFSTLPAPGLLLYGSGSCWRPPSSCRGIQSLPPLPCRSILPFCHNLLTSFTLFGGSLVCCYQNGQMVALYFRDP